MLNPYLAASEILLVEDNPADVYLVREALADGNSKAHMSVVGDGVDALKFLRKEAPYEKAPTPNFVLLDLNLPRKHGKDVLSEIKQDENLRHIPVVVLTTSALREDVLESYRRHANCYITKPVDLNQFLDVLREVEFFWGAMAARPAI